ncbi:glycolate oxidase subunit GlcF [Zavarzinia compransoris]|uniref:Glycolate oxidase iron-sulfur subunit n=1 Tax=Zavarzinia compransoris TaxID=1264899 RepID=A0A317E0S6_9PROT|nr:glycolate oxidase subunit GlcF [Zavarzinia compransoris]PWR18755.1 glycolate oxidase iron-sulfur subunit [Zavarzinia compransoris]TDP48738.1 glycolate oxidase iron-sulfur subunit [Zavarzinia compransoris]
MRTSFTPERLADPAIAEIDSILRKCVHCGFCTATCPTYLETGDELDGPRGRIYLMKEMFEAGRPADAVVRDHLDRCLGCFSCMSTCPSGVDYAHLVEHGKAHVEATAPRPLLDRGLRAVLALMLPGRRRFRLSLLAGVLAAPVLRRLPGRLGALGALVPARLPGRIAIRPGTLHPAAAGRRGRVALVIGCIQPVLRPGVDAAAVRLLNRHGIEVVVPPAAGCCGALPLHMGKEARGRAAAAALVDALGPVLDGLDAVIVTASGCGTTVKDYGHLLHDDPLRADKARRIAALARDVTEVLDPLDLRPTGAAGGREIAYHDACSLRHGQRVTAPKRLLARAGFVVREPRDPHLCCGSAGTYNMLQPALSAPLGDNKAKALAATGAPLIAAGNIGCMTQIAQHGTLPVVHTVELLDWATGGPRPDGVEGMA